MTERRLVKTLCECAPWDDCPNGKEGNERERCCIMRLEVEPVKPALTAAVATFDFGGKIFGLPFIVRKDMKPGVIEIWNGSEMVGRITGLK